METGHFEFAYMEVTEEEEIEGNRKQLAVRRGELRVMQTLLEVGEGVSEAVWSAVCDGLARSGRGGII